LQVKTQVAELQAKLAAPLPQLSFRLMIDPEQATPIRAIIHGRTPPTAAANSQTMNIQLWHAGPSHLQITACKLTNVLGGGETRLEHVAIVPPAASPYKWNITVPALALIAPVPDQPNAVD